MPEVTDPARYGGFNAAREVAAPRYPQGYGPDTLPREIDNIVPQSFTANRSYFLRMENELADAIQSGGKVTDFKITVNYADKDSFMPASFDIEAKINGFDKTWSFEN